MMSNSFKLMKIGAALLASSLLQAETTTDSIEIDLNTAAEGKPISADLFGIFFEDLNYAADGGLYAELIQNRSFEYNAAEQADWGPFTAWELVQKGEGQGRWRLGNARPVHRNNPHYLLLEVTEPGEGVGVRNGGFDGIPVKAGNFYEVSFWSYQAFMGKMWGDDSTAQNQAMPVILRLESKDGEVLAEAELEIKGRDWKKYRVQLQSSATDPDARFVLLAAKQGGLAIDMISLFPEDTYKNRTNGLRRDLARTIAGLHPKFMRFPGGCLVHGSGTHQFYDWKKSVGPVEQRQAQRNLWGYHQTLGLGYFEYFQFCEDIGAIPLPVVAAGVCCQHGGDSPGRGQEGLTHDEMPGYIQDVLDLIEWANGPADSRWGSIRAAAGHPESFGLKYLGLGNEDAITPTFKKRFKLIYDAIREKHPEIVIIGTTGPFPSGEDYDKGWEFARELGLEMVDEHYYRSPEWFWENLERYDSYDREGSRVYAGEYAAHEPDRRNTLRSALAEAAGCIGFEKNGDIVHFASYAPMLSRRGHTQWHPDLIYFDATGVYPSINYQVQKLFSRNSGDTLLPATVTKPEKNQKLAASTVRDSKTGEIIIKIVNGEDKAFTATINLSSRNNQAYLTTTTVLSGDSPDVANEDGKPEAASLHSERNRVAGRFDHAVPANSLVIIRLQKEQNSKDSLSWTNPLIPQRADPHVYRHTDGYYYLTATVPDYDCIELRRAKSIDGLRSAPVKVIWTPPATGPMSGPIWAPEIHLIKGIWYIYLSAGDKSKNWGSIRPCALSNSSPDPLEGIWKSEGQIITKWESFSLDATTFEHEGTRYFVWTQVEPDVKGTNIMIAEMDTPTSITGKQVIISRPELPWEQQVYRVDEAPAVLIRNGKVFIAFSASATDHNYCMGLLTAEAEADLLDPDSWTKSPEPFFMSNPATGQYGPGHCSFTTSPDGQTDILVYHARNYKKIAGDALDNPDRATRAQIVDWRTDGTPDFGIPVADGVYDGNSLTLEE